MKTTIIILSFIYLFFSTTSFAASMRPVCFDMLWQAASDSNAEGRQEDGSYAFVKLNDNQSVYFERDRRKSEHIDNGHFLDSHSTGCTGAENFNVGNNLISMSFVLGNGGIAITSGWLKVSIVMLLPDGGSIKVAEEAFNADPKRTDWSFHGSVNLALKQIAPDVFSLAEQKKSEINEDLKKLNALSPTYAADLKKYEEIIDQIKGRLFSELNEVDMAEYAEATEKYRFLKAKIDEQNQTIAHKTENLKASAAQARLAIEAAIASEGLNLNASDFLDVSLSLNLDPMVSVDHSHAAEKYPYDEWASQTLQDLRYRYDSGFRNQVIEKAMQWTLQSELLLKMLTDSATISRSELNAYEVSNKTVKDYLFGDGVNQSGILTDDFWIKDLNIDIQTRSAIDIDLASRDPERAKRLKSYINGLTTFSERIVTNLKFLAELSKVYKETQNEAERTFIDKVIDGGIAVIQNVAALAECIALNQAAGPYADFYEIYYEKDFCSGEPNEEADRIIASGSLVLEAGGLLIGGPAGLWLADRVEEPVKVLKRLFRVVGNSIGLEKSLNLAHTLFSAAKNKLGSSEGVLNFFEILKKPFPENGEMGSIGISLENTINKLQFPELWSQSKNKSAVKNAFGHWKKHRNEFPEVNNALEYVEKAHAFMKNPPSETLIKIRANGEKVFYDAKSEIFGVQAVSGAPKTMFKPNPAVHGYVTNLDYFNAQ